MTLDRQLNMKTHVENVSKKASKRLNLIKRLASTSWGADKNMLRSLYLGYVRSVMDYNIVLQNSCSKATRQELDKVQNQALRLICGGMRTSPTAACEISANIEPLELRRQKAALDLYERAKRMDPTHPCRVLVDKWKCLARLQQKSILHVVEDLKLKHHLPDNRAPLEKVNSTLPPHGNVQIPTTKARLIDGSNKKSDPNTLKLASLETIDAYPKDWIKVYTDGSAFKATVNAGYGAVIYYPNGTTTEMYDSCGAFCSNFVAEQEAILQATSHIKNTFETSPHLATNIVIFTDSLSTIQTLENLRDESKEISQITYNIHQLMYNYNTEVVLQWIPGHSGIQGNEAADKLAKQGAALPQPDNPVTYDTVKGMINSNIKEEWLNNWASNTTGRVLFTNMTRPNPRDPINKLPRGNQSTIFRLRTGHVPLNGFLSRIKKDHPAQCRLCNHPNESVEHHLLHCPRLSDLRRELLPKHPSIGNTFFGNTFQLQDTCDFFYRASGRRAEAQRPLVRQ